MYARLNLDHPGDVPVLKHLTLPALFLHLEPCFGFSTPALLKLCIEARIGLVLKDQQSSLIFVRSGYAFVFPGIFAIIRYFILKMPTSFQRLWVFSIPVTPTR